MSKDTLRADVDRGTDLMNIVHRIYRELLLDAKEFEKALEAQLAAGKGGHATVDSRVWLNKVRVDQFATGKQHGAMGSAAGFVRRVMAKCGRNPWSIIPHTHECEDMRAQEENHAHVCGFYAVWIEEHSPATRPVKITFPLVHATDPAWVMTLAVDILDLFNTSGSRFYWNVPAPTVADLANAVAAGAAAGGAADADA